MARGKDELLQIELGDSSSLDIIKLDETTILIVIAERGSVQRRTVATIDLEDAIRMAKFLVGIKESSDEQD